MFGRIFILILLLIISGVTSVQAKTNEEKPPNLTFVYINGSNNNNDKMKNWYVNGVKKLHPAIKKKFEKNSSIKKWLEKHNWVINKKPHIFFWGYDSKQDLEYVWESVDISKAFTSLIAFKMRSMLTQFLHDAIWIQKEHNMMKVISDLNDDITMLSAQGQNIVLYGYSAGTFVTYQYLIYKLPYINLNQFFKVMKADGEFLEFVNNNPKNDTCLYALAHPEIGLGVLSNTGHFVLYQNKNTLKSRYLNMNRATQKYCAPQGKIKAVVNFASPIPLFYSDMADNNYEINYYTKHMYKYVFENGIYLLTINFREDPLGFPTNQNLTLKEFEDMYDIKLDNPSGVVYDNSKVWSKRSALFAHTSYWSARKIFPNEITKTFVGGTKFMYDEKYQKNMLKKRKKEPQL